MLFPRVSLSASCGLDFCCHIHTPLLLPLIGQYASAGFPSPAEDYIEDVIDLGKLLVTNPNATFFARVKGDSMQDALIYDGDVLITDRSIKPKSGSIVIAFIDGAFTVKRLLIKDGKPMLKAENAQFPPISIGPEADFRIWGVISYIIHKAR